MRKKFKCVTKIKYIIVPFLLVLLVSVLSMQGVFGQTLPETTTGTFTLSVQTEGELYVGDSVDILLTAEHMNGQELTVPIPNGLTYLPEENASIQRVENSLSITPDSDSWSTILRFEALEAGDISVKAVNTENAIEQFIVFKVLQEIMPTAYPTVPQPTISYTSPPDSEGRRIWKASGTIPYIGYDQSKRMLYRDITAGTNWNIERFSCIGDTSKYETDRYYGIIGHTYEVRISVSSGNVFLESEPLFFKVTAVPEANIPNHSNVGQTTVILNGTFKQNGGANPFGQFQFSKNSDFSKGFTGWNWNNEFNWEDGWSSAAVTGLEPNTTYYYRNYVRTSAGEVWSEPNSFKTLHAPPVVHPPTNRAPGVTTVTLDGTFNVGTGDPSFGQFQFSKNSDFSKGFTGWNWNNGFKWEDGWSSAAVTGLEPNTTYYYRNYVRTSAGERYSEVRSFRTKHAPPTVYKPELLTIAKTGAYFKGNYSSTAQITSTEYIYKKSGENFISNSERQKLFYTTSAPLYYDRTLSVDGIVLTANTRYQVAVRMGNEGGVSPFQYSDFFWTKPDYSAPTVTQITCNDARIQGTYVHGSGGIRERDYRYRKIDGEWITVSGSLDYTIGNYFRTLSQDNGNAPLEPNTEYEVSIRMGNEQWTGATCSDWTTPTRFKTKPDFTSFSVTTDPVNHNKARLSGVYNQGLTNTDITGATIVYGTDEFLNGATTTLTGKKDGSGDFTFTNAGFTHELELPDGIHYVKTTLTNESGTTASSIKKVVIANRMISITAPVQVDFSVTPESRGEVASDNFEFTNESQRTVKASFTKLTQQAGQMDGVTLVSHATNQGELHLNLVAPPLAGNRFTTNVSNIVPDTPYTTELGRLGGSIASPTDSKTGTLKIGGKYAGNIPGDIKHPKVDFVFHFELLE